ncbi:MAG: cupin domain-containing protein [Gemmataceae bacterium]
MTVETQPERAADFPRTGEAKEQRSGANFSLVKLGGSDELKRYGIRHPLSRATVHGKVFLKQLLDLTGMEISFGSMPPHAAVPFHHKHQENEEVYLFLGGRGQMQIDGDIIDVEEGTAVRIAPEGVRTWRNTSDQELFYIVIQARAGSLQRWTGTDGLPVPEPVEWPA